MKVVGIIAAGGSAERLGRAGGKQVLGLAGRPVAAWAADALAAAALVDELVVVCDPGRVREYAATIGAALTTDKPVSFVAGGQTRAESVCAGLVVAAAEADASQVVVAIHDGARPLLKSAEADAAIQLLLDRAPTVAGVVLGHPAIDTLKQVTDVSPAGASSPAVEVITTPPRSDYWLVQTPQVFFADVLLATYGLAATVGFAGTDDASYVEAAGGRVLLQAGSRDNIKITVAEDLQAAEVKLAYRTGL